MAASFCSPHVWRKQACMRVCMCTCVHENQWPLALLFPIIAGWAPLQGRRNSLCPATWKGLLILCQHRRNQDIRAHLSLSDQMPDQWHLEHLCYAKPHARF